MRRGDAAENPENIFTSLYIIGYVVIFMWDFFGNISK